MKVKKIMLFALVIFLSIGIFMNSNYINEKKTETYAKLKEEYGLSSDIKTNELIEEKEETIEELPKDENIEESQKEKQDVTSEKVTVTSRGATEKRTTENIIWDFLINEGYTKIQTAAIIGNLYQESGLNPSRIESNGEGIGLVQWSFGRKQQLKKYAASKGKDWTDLNTQLEFLVMELKGGKQFYGKQKSTFDNPYSVDEATAAFCWGFERPNISYANIANRTAKAWATYYRNVNR